MELHHVVIILAFDKGETIPHPSIDAESIFELTLECLLVTLAGLDLAPRELPHQGQDSVVGPLGDEVGILAHDRCADHAHSTL